MSGAWQDYVLAVGPVLFILALVPALPPHAAKPPRSTCLLTGVVLLVCAGTLATLSLWWAAVMNALCGAVWIYLTRRRA